MKKISIIVVLIIIFSGCSQKLENEILERDKSVEELNQTILKLESTNKELRLRNSMLSSDIDMIKAEINDSEATLGNVDDENKNLKDELVKKDEEIMTLVAEKENNFQRYFDLLLYIHSLNQFEYVELIRDYEDLNDIHLVNSFSNIYDINDVKIGDVINGFEITEIDVSTYSDVIGETEATRMGKLNDNFVRVKFDGYFVLSGRLGVDTCNGMYSMMVDSNELVYNMPISSITHEYCLNSSSYQMFDIENQEFLIEELGSDIAKELYENEDKHYNIVGIFMEYKYNTPIHETSSHHVKLVAV